MVPTTHWHVMIKVVGGDDEGCVAVSSSTHHTEIAATDITNADREAIREIAQQAARRLQIVIEKKARRSCR